MSDTPLIQLSAIAGFLAGSNFLAGSGLIGLAKKLWQAQIICHRIWCYREKANIMLLHRHWRRSCDLVVSPFLTKLAFHFFAPSLIAEQGEPIFNSG